MFALVLMFESCFKTLNQSDYILLFLRKFLCGLFFLESVQVDQEFFRNYQYVSLTARLYKNDKILLYTFG